MSRRGLLACALALGALSCGDGGGFGGPVRVDLEAARPPERLSEFRLLRWDAGAGRFEYNERVVPYDLGTPLFSDYALKDRAIYVPEGEAMAYREDEAFVFPVGTVIVKSFSFPADFRAPDVDRTVIETRVLVHHADGWRAWPYIWDAAQEDAFLAPAGEVRTIGFVDAEGEARTSEYLVPQRNQCGSCHALQESPGSEATFITPIGPKARHLNRDFVYEGEARNQLDHMTALGLLEGMPGPAAEEPAAFDFARLRAEGVGGLSAEEIERGARDYLDINCAHCHNPRGVQGVTSQLFLQHDAEDAFRLGVCKRPGSAGEGTGGLTFDIVPGDPDQSILVFRMETEEVGAMMPLLGRSLAHDEGVELVRAWIAAMEPRVCE